MAIVGERWGLFNKLKDWVKDDRPIWGTCAGMILLSDHCIKQAENGQSLVGGLDAHICRNYFGSQIHSCRLSIDVDPKAALEINCNSSSSSSSSSSNNNNNNSSSSISSSSSSSIIISINK